MKKTYLNSFCARCLTLLVLALLSTNLAWGAEVEYKFTPNQTTTGNSATAYVTTAYSFTYNEIGWSFNQWNPSTLQIKTNQSSAGSEFNFKNTSAFPGRIKSVVITFKALAVSNESGLCFVGGTSAISSLSGGSAGTWNSTTKTLTWTPASNDNFTYFAFYQNGKVATGTNNLAEKDAIVITYEKGTGPSLSVSPATIDFGEVYQNATVDAKEVTVSFANLTTNDVAAAISGTAFDINKTSSFTSGDKITITPTTATLGKYSETLTVSATGVDDQKVTVTMNVVEAPSWIYKHVTDASTLKDGNVIVLGAVKDDTWYVNGGCSDDNKYLVSKGATCEDDILKSSDAVEITLKETTGGWYLKIGEKYINTTAAKALTFADDASTVWTITIDENGIATVSAGDYGRFLYNATSPRFLNYTSDTSASMLLPQIYRKEVSAKITSTGYATFSSEYALDLSNLPEGLTAYKATTANNGKVHMVAVEEAVAAKTGLFLEGVAGKTYTIPVAASGNALEGNLLEATTGEALAEGNYVYVIANNAFQPLGQATVVSKGKAYIPASKITIPTEGKLEISFGEPTGIKSLTPALSEGKGVYNLNGMKVNEAYKGIVIMNGKKYINK